MAESLPDPLAGRRDTVTFQVPAALRARARETYRRTAAAEDDTSWAHFLAKAVLREVERREELHNAGGRYPVADERLRPGRGSRRRFSRPGADA
jgi:hypothetical protein